MAIDPIYLPRKTVIAHPQDGTATREFQLLLDQILQRLTNALLGVTSTPSAVLTTDAAGVPGFRNTLPALNGSNLTDLNASALTTGTVPQARKWSAATITLTGQQDDLAFGNVDELRCANADLLTITGIAAGVGGQRLALWATGTAAVELSPRDPASALANQLIVGIVDPITLAAGRGHVLLEYDDAAQRWRVLWHEQGTSLTPAFDATLFTADSGDWTVDATDVVTWHYTVRGRRVALDLSLVGTTVSATPLLLLLTLPGNLEAARTVATLCALVDNGTAAVGVLGATAGSALLAISRLDGTALATSVDATGLTGQIEIEVA